MKSYTIILIIISHFLCFSTLFPQDENFYIDREKLYKQELTRYQKIFQNERSDKMLTSSIDVKYYLLDLTITTSPNYLKGRVLLTAKSLQNGKTSITLDLMNALTIDSVKVGGTITSFIQSTSSFNVTLDKVYNNGDMMEVEIFYQGVPGSSGFGSFEFSSHSSTPWVWSLSEPYGAKDWWPCNDHPMDKADSADIFVTCNSAFKVGSNGKLLSVVDNGNGTSTHHWKTVYPISTYLISIALTNYSEFSNWFKYSPTDSMQVLNYVLPEHLSSAQAGLPRAVDGLQIFSQLFGLYPFINEKYGHAEFGWSGGMEHQTMTYLGGFSEYLVIHELSHQWFGDMITCRTWPDLWLNEGFASYCEALYGEKRYGMSSYWSVVNADMNSAKSAVGTLYLQDTNSVGNMFAGSRVYSKGSSVLHMLRHVIGDSAFFQSMYNYANDPNLKYGTASTRDFQSVCEATSGMDLDFFFDEWVFGEKYPRYTYGWTSEPSSGGYKVTLGINQTTLTPNPVFFTMPIDIQVLGIGWDTTIVVFNNQQNQTFEFEVSHHPTSLQFDPGNWILKTKDSMKTFTLSSTSRNFKNVFVNFSKIDSVTVFNTGLTTLEITSVTSDHPYFSIYPLSATVPISASQKFYITFTPIDTGTATGHISFYHNAPTSPDILNVTGKGIAPSVSVSAGWNMVSIPFSVIDPQTTTIFPTAISSAFTYEGGPNYIVSDSLLKGKGYWIKFASNQSQEIIGSAPMADTVDVVEGWNMIGSTLNTVHVGSIQTLPEGIVSSNYFEYASSYKVVDSLRLGKGYWVKISQAGKLILDGANTFKKNLSSENNLQSLNKIIIRDSKNNQQTLYFGKYSGEIKIEKYDLPPTPPIGSFDVRFQSGRYLEVVKGQAIESFPIHISSDNYPLTLEWNIKQSDVYSTIVIGNKKISLNGNGEFQIPESSIRDQEKLSQIVLQLNGVKELPGEFTLEQNYPNPFNPSTVIDYSLPVDCWVKLKVFDVLGQEVKTLVDGYQDAGYHRVSFSIEDESMSNISSGLYFYRLQIRNYSGELGNQFISTRKMLLLR
jgi:aminopeptidase N